MVLNLNIDEEKQGYYAVLLTNRYPLANSAHIKFHALIGFNYFLFIILFSVGYAIHLFEFL